MQHQPKHQLDHLVVIADSLANGVEYVESILGVGMQAGGEHPLMGTHNRLLKISPDVFLEVIAINPSAKPPQRSRWFGMDELSGPLPRLATWAVNTTNLTASFVAAPLRDCEAVPVSRGDLQWEIGLPRNGKMLMGGACPTLLQWPVGVHPTSTLDDVGCQLLQLDVQHPDALLVQQSFEEKLADDRVVYTTASAIALKAVIQTPNGVVELT
jgi:hypothetical protein